MSTASASSDTDVQSALPVVEPADAEAVARVLAEADAAGKAVLPRGGGTKADWGNPPRSADVILSTRKLNRLLEHAAGDMTATVEAGCTVTDLLHQLALRGQRLAIDPLWPGRATIGGVLATNDNGSLRGAFGGLRDLIIGVTVALADGTLARSGGKVVKNVAGYDLPKLMVGSYGTLGVITQATFRLHPLPAATRTMSWSGPDVESVQRFVAGVLDSSVPVSALQWTVGRDTPPPVDVALEGSQAGLEAQARVIASVAQSCGLAPSAPPESFNGRRDSLWQAAGPSVICKVSVLPSEGFTLCYALSSFVPSGQSWDLCVQGAGTGWLRFAASDPSALAGTLRTMRRKLELLRGSLLVLRCPPEVRREVDAWGYATDALPLMRRIKQQFDPNGTLNPGRFVGGI